MKNSLRHCPICNCENVKILHSQNFLVPENYPLPKSYDVVCCDQCGFVFADTIATQDVYDFFYTRWSKYEDSQTATGGGESVYDAMRLRETALQIDQLFSDKSISILDVGCGNGGLLDELKKLGYSNLSGLDPSSICVQNIRNKHIEAFEGSIFNMNILQDRTFDLVILSHVLEHICNLRIAKNNLSSIVKKEGYLYIETPDASRYKDYFILPYYYFDTEHINHYDEYFHELLFSDNFSKVVSGKKNMLVNGNLNYPAVFSLLCKDGKAKISSTVKYEVVEESVEEFINQSKKENNISFIEGLKESQEPIVIFGAGNYAMRLLANSDLSNCNISFFIDNDSKKRKKSILGKEIKDISALKEFNGLVVICSALFSVQIKEQIVRAGYENKIIVI